jgi:nitroimidazol reductase NimA-like FMN-containing flavoprotein (pyridoxamine 5'-phosphate oxidase superfamily)
MNAISNINHGGQHGHPHGSMRRKEREITDQNEIQNIVRQEKVLHLAMVDQNNMPFLVPLFYAYDGTNIFFHSAKAGTKIEILKHNNNVCFEIFTGYQIIEDDKACDFEARHKTVIGFGKAYFVEDVNEKQDALKRIVAQFTDKQFDFPMANLNATNVVRIDIQLLKGKKHGVS